MGAALSEEPAQAPLVQHGTMHAAIGKGEHQGRVALSSLAKPGFYGVGALEGLAGEVTIVDGEVVVSVVDGGAIESVDPTGRQATLLVGAQVEAWRETRLDAEIAAGDFDAAIARATDVDGEEPFVFVVRGAVRELHYHVINGACPVHARRAGIELSEEQQPASRTLATGEATLVGIFARDAAGKLTHPNTSTHVHVVLEEADGRRVTGHVESVALEAGASLRLPAGSAVPGHQSERLGHAAPAE